MESVPTTTDSKMAIEEHGSADEAKNQGSGVEDKEAEKPERSSGVNVNEDKVGHGTENSAIVLN